MSEEIQANVVHLKRDDKAIFATDSQVAIITSMRNDPDRRHNFVKVGRLTFSPMDVAYIESQVRPRYDYPDYFLQRYNRERSNIISK